jgi:curved DNA-binding protein CbpA
VNPLATREEIKRSYFRLAKLSHPDALLDKPGNADGVDFQEIAEAWKVLGNTKLRRRYDRELTAKAWSLRAQAYTNERLEKAVPVVADMMDNIAVPFLRKTTATTWAVGQAIATGVSGFSRSSRKTTNQQRQQPAAAAAAAVPQTEEIVNGDQISEATSDPNSVSPFDAASSETQQNSNGRMSAPQQAYKTQARPIGLTDTFLQALEAGAQAAREIDSLELSEKSGQLEERYVRGEHCLCGPG